MAVPNPSKKALVQDAIQLFIKEFGENPTFAACAPGRVNLIGEHTDYNAGFVLPMALPLTTVVVGRKINGTMAKVVTMSDSVSEIHRTEFSVEKNQLQPGLPKWANYVKGVLAFFPTPVPGFEAVYNTSVPIGGGLSSSASMEVATFTFLEALTNTKARSLVEKALICQKAEHEFPKMPCGLMDQFISTMGKEDNALLIDCKTNTAELIPMQDPNLVILIINSNVKHELTGSEYPSRKKQCYEAAQLLNLPSLREATLDDIQKLEAKNADPTLIKRARHVIGEIKRTADAAEMLRAKDYITFGKLMNESHNSLRDDYEVSCSELDALVTHALAVKGVYGSRMTGAGFGGCTVTLVHKDSVQATIENVKKNYAGNATFYICVPSNGAEMLSMTCTTCKQKKH